MVLTLMAHDRSDDICVFVLTGSYIQAFHVASHRLIQESGIIFPSHGGIYNLH